MQSIRYYLHFFKRIIYLVKVPILNLLKRVYLLFEMRNIGAKIAFVLPWINPWKLRSAALNAPADHPGQHAPPLFILFQKLETNNLIQAFRSDAPSDLWHTVGSRRHVTYWGSTSQSASQSVSVEKVDFSLLMSIIYKATSTNCIFRLSVASVRLGFRCKDAHSLTA